MKESLKEITRGHTRGRIYPRMAINELIINCYDCSDLYLICICDLMVVFDSKYILGTPLF